jgi:choice-of-anchor B domain-containing protein
MKKYVFAILLSSTHSIWSQLNVDSLSHIDYQALHGANLNDVWGYVDETGNEYAVVGTSKGTSIVDVTNPTNPQEVFWLPGTESIWRDPCVYGNYAYVTTEAQDGLTIIDLSPLPASNILPTTIYTGPLGNPWQSAHTCFVDENGFAYIFGSNRGNGGVIILNVAVNPMNPQEVGTFDNWYVHDGYARNDTLYLAHIYDGFFSLVDVTVKSNPILLGTQATPDDFTHNIWPSQNGQFVFTTDEVSGAYIGAYDITDPLNIKEVDRTQHSPGQGVLPHNTHVRGNHLITSYYSDGIVIHDVTYPYNMIKVGQYDTYPLQTAGFDGCWGVYPFLPSGTILASDITEGLFILGPTYVQASYLEGTVTDALTLQPVSQVKAQITGNDQNDLTDISGAYATGMLLTGNVDVTYSKVGYFPQTISVNLTQGVITQQDVQLVPIPPYNLTVNVIDATNGNPISDAQISLQADLLEHTGISNGLGVEDFVLYYQEAYWITVAKWGYMTNCYEWQINQATGTITVSLSPGYHDEFTFDLGWTVGGTATAGIWERGIPNPTSDDAAPGIDMDYDCGNRAYVTGNEPSLQPDLDDVDGGYTQLVSPVMDLTSYPNPHINFAQWFFCLHGNPPDDTLEVIVSNGLTSVTISKTGSEPSQFFQWIPKSIRLLDFITPTANMQVFFKVSDNDGNVNITEAGVDYFNVSNSNVLSLPTNEIDAPVYPNPFSQSLSFPPTGKEEGFELFDLQGNVLIHGVSSASDLLLLDTRSIPAGTYLCKRGSFTYKLLKIQE